jgi:acylphosphatase
MNLKRWHILITGKVQGVFFRVHMQQIARSLGFTGWVSNRADGCVEAILEGSETNLAALLDWCREGPPRSVVSTVEVRDEQYSGDYTDFSVRY